MSHRNILPPHWTELDRAAYLTVHEFKQGRDEGSSALAPLVGKNPRSLDNEVNPDYEGAKLGLRDSAVLQNGARDYRILHAYSRLLNHVAVPLADWSTVSDIELLDAHLTWMEETGKTAASIRRALKDGVITREELEEIQCEFHVDVTRFQELLARLEGMIRDGR